MYAKSQDKREKILKAAHGVFLEKGFRATTMQDIIEACGISRGGMYFYFSSVEQVFLELLQSRKRTTVRLLRHMLAESQSFAELLDSYFAWHAERLSQMHLSLLAATVEYGSARKTPEAVAFIEGLFSQTRESIMMVLGYGARHGGLGGDLDVLADHIMFTIDGLNVKCMTVGTDAGTVNAQLGLLKAQVLAACRLGAGPPAVGEAAEGSTGKTEGSTSKTEEEPQ